MQIFEFVDLFQTLLFRFKKHSFLSRILKNPLLWLHFFKNYTWEKGRFFDRNHWLTPLQIFEFLVFFRTLLFRSKKHSFLSRISKSDFFVVRFPPKTVYKIVFEFVLHRKQAFLDYRNIGVVKSKNWIFSKGLIHGFGLRLTFFVHFVLFVKIFSKEVINLWFWPKIVTFFVLYFRSKLSIKSSLNMFYRGNKHF